MQWNYRKIDFYTRSKMHEEGVRNGYCCQLDKGNNTWLLKNNKDVKHFDPESVSGEDNNNDNSVVDDADDFVDLHVDVDT